MAGQVYYGRCLLGLLPLLLLLLLLLSHGLAISEGSAPRARMHSTPDKETDPFRSANFPTVLYL